MQDLLCSEPAATSPGFGGPTSLDWWRCVEGAGAGDATRHLIGRWSGRDALGEGAALQEAFGTDLETWEATLAVRT